MEKSRELQTVVGDAGMVAANNVQRLRGDMSYAELGRRLEEIGHPIPTLGLRRMEKGQRRIDVDDLVALAQVFGVSPLGILLPYGLSYERIKYLSTKRDGADQSVRDLWRWALAQETLTDDEDVRLLRVRTIPQWLIVSIKEGQESYELSERERQPLTKEQIGKLIATSTQLNLSDLPDGRVLVFGGPAGDPIIGTLDNEDLMQIITSRREVDSQANGDD
jgi:transcriptional regulator with XRE-family HTH domain